MGTNRSPLFEIASVLVRFDHVASFVVNANHSLPIRLAKLARFFQNSGHMKTTTLPLRTLMNRSPLCAFLLIPFVLACFALSPQARADCQEGCDTVNFNTFLGEDALLDHTGVSNTAVGWHALKNNSNTLANTAIGAGALENNGSYDNTASGASALGDNTGGHDNTATGSSALSLNTTGSDNTATGFSALGTNTTGNFNVANGMWALFENKTGAKNTATGYGALFNTTGKLNIALGFNAGGNLTTGNHNIDIGNPGVAGEGNTIRIGATQSATFISGISGVTVGNRCSSYRRRRRSSWYDHILCTL